MEITKTYGFDFNGTSFTARNLDQIKIAANGYAMSFGRSITIYEYTTRTDKNGISATNTKIIDTVESF